MVDLLNEITTDHTGVKMKQLLDELDLRMRGAAESILKSHSISDRDDREMAHFTDINGMMDILGLPIETGHQPAEVSTKSIVPQTEDAPVCLWLSDTSAMNDPLEGKALADCWLDDKLQQQCLDTWSRNHYSSEDWNQLRLLGNCLFDPSLELPNTDPLNRNLDRRPLICSFSAEPDRLDLWRAYGRNGEGVSMSMPLLLAKHRLQSLSVPSVDQLPESQPFQLYYVHYTSELLVDAWRTIFLSVRDVLGELLSLAILGDQSKNKQTNWNSETVASIRKTVRPHFEKISHLYKHEQFSGENEIRLMRIHDFAELDPSNASGLKIAEQEIRAFQSADERQIPRIYSESPAFFLKGEPNFRRTEHLCRIILGPKMEMRERWQLSLEHSLRLKWKLSAPAVQQSEVRYR